MVTAHYIDTKYGKFYFQKEEWNKMRNMKQPELLASIVTEFEDYIGMEKCVYVTNVIQIHFMTGN